MKKGKIPGCALALVDDKGILWTEGFGTTDFKRKIPVTPNTVFCIGSVSKTLTATAVLLAVQDGMVDLDEPITTYLPDLKVYSPYEDRPERKITLRHLLGHTSGLPHEAVGCNGLEPEGTLEDRIRGIHGLWLKCPVGEGYSYSGAGYDLASYVLQVVSGLPFEQYMEENVFRPLGMLNTTLDQNRIRSNAHRAIGHTIGMARMPLGQGCFGAGGIFTNAIDLAHLVRFLISRGGGRDNHLLSGSLMDVMLTPHAHRTEEEGHYYGLGIGINQASEETEMIHSGGTGGFSATMYWFPKYGVGALVLANRMPHNAFLPNTARRRKLIDDGRFKAHFPESKLDCKQCIPKWTTWSDHAPSSYKPEWKRYCGKYDCRVSGYKLKWYAKLAFGLNIDQLALGIKVFEKDGYFHLTESRLFEAFSAVHSRQVDSKLMEVKSGVFYTASGDVLDFTGKDPAWCSYRLKK
jgi:CubicO group peptidase (beta-lactamase class C family)